VKAERITAIGFVLIALLCAGVANGARAKKPQPVEVLYIYSWAHCAPCKALEKAIHADGGTTKQDPLKSKPLGVLDFPTVVYSDGTKDNGAKIYNKQARVPKNVLIILWTGN
jgi:hypothetical protein